MKDNSKKVHPQSVFVECKLVEITDPAEFAELDRRCRAAERKLAELASPKMAKWPRKPKVKSSLQECELVEITDPAEQAALDRRCREAEKMLAGRANPKKAKPRKGK